jgi:hypothetical protein
MARATHHRDTEDTANETPRGYGFHGLTQLDTVLKCAFPAISRNSCPL